MEFQNITDEESLRVLEKLVRCDTCQPEGNEERIIKLIDGMLPDALERKIISCGKNRASLVAKLPGKTDRGGLAFLGHVDTVACGDVADWKYDPHAATCVDGVLYGRGAADMKGGDTAMILAARELAAKDERPEKPIYFCFTADEESGGAGILSMEEQGLFDELDEMIVCEPSDEKISFCEKGALWLRLKIRGVASHASRPHLGRNAVEYGIWFVQKLREKILETKQHPILGNTTMAVTKFHGGNMTNIVPAEASLEVDIRTIPGVSHQELCQTAETLCRNMQTAYSNVTTELTVLNNRPAIECDVQSAFREKIADAARESGLDMQKRGHQFFTDASLVLPKHNIPFVIAGPGDDKQAHVANENIPISSVTRFAKFYARYLEQNYFSARAAKEPV